MQSNTVRAPRRLRPNSRTRCSRNGDALPEDPAVCAVVHGFKVCEPLAAKTRRAYLRSHLAVLIAIAVVWSKERVSAVAPSCLIHEHLCIGIPLYR
jgi:hypothetical protein